MNERTDTPCPAAALAPDQADSGRQALRGRAWPALLWLLLVGAFVPAWGFEVMSLPPGQAPVVIDGHLDDTPWRLAPRHARFSQLAPKAGAAVDEGLRTVVQVLVDGQALVIGVRAWSPQAPRVLLSRRDAVQRDQDMIGLWIDTSGRRETALFVKASLTGVVSDGLYRASDDEEDLGPDFPVQVAATTLPDGYSMEIRWPLSALRYPYDARAPWQMVVARAIPDAGDLLLVSGDADGDALDFLHAARPMSGLQEALARHRDRQELQAQWEWTGRQIRQADRRIGQGSLGLEGWWRPRADWVVNLTLNPDFAQIDVDEPQVSGNRAVALALPEKRRYFLESADVLGLPLPAFYSRTVADPRWGLRATWRGDKADATALFTEDRAGALALRGRPWGTDTWALTAPSEVQLLRGRWQTPADHGGLTQGLLWATRRLDAQRFNQLLGVDGLWRSNQAGQHLQAQWNLMASDNTVDVDADGQVLGSARAAERGWQAWGKALYSDERWFNLAEVKFTSPEFVNLVGFVDQAGLWSAQFELNRRLGEQAVPFTGGAWQFHQTEWHLGLRELRSLRDASRAEPGGETIRRELRAGGWLAAPGRTTAWLSLGADQQRARSGGALHDTPALHGGFESTPWPWLARLVGEGSWGQQLDTELDRVGRGGWWSLKANTRWALAQGRSLEVDPLLTGVRIAPQGGYPALSETGLRVLTLVHLSAHESLRAIVQVEQSHRGAGITEAAQRDRKTHRSLMWRKRVLDRWQWAVGAQWDTRTGQAARREFFIKLQSQFGAGG